MADVQNLGCILEPGQTDLPSIESLLGAAPLPQSFIVPAWRECFDENFNFIPEKIHPRIRNQSPQDSCVGHGMAVSKSAQEGVEVSERDIFTGAKKRDGDPRGFGTTISAAQKALIEEGVAERSLVDPNPNVPPEYYRDRASYSTPEVIENRKLHKGLSPHYVPRELMRQTIFQFQIPLVTSCMWYEQDMDMPSGIMEMPHSNPIFGHCFAYIGWIKSNEIMPNSFGIEFGKDGLFLVPQNGVINRLNGAQITIDMPVDLVAILKKYNGLDVRVPGEAGHYRIEKGQKRQYPDEITWWAHGRLFGINVYDIAKNDFDAIPEGPKVSIDEAPFATRELTRQVRQFYGKL